MYRRSVTEILKQYSKNTKFLQIHPYGPQVHRSVATRHRRENAVVSSFKSALKRINIFDFSSTKLKMSGYVLYESIADRVPYMAFFKSYNLPDTFYSWFVVTELHVWMLSVRAMAEDADGIHARNAIIEALWADVQTRIKKLGDANPSAIREQVCQLSEEFQAAIVGYDEGLLSGDDRILAGAIWRRFFQRKCMNAKHLEEMVLYVRKQIKYLDDIDREQLFDKRDIKWTAVGN